MLVGPNKAYCFQITLGVLYGGSKGDADRVLAALLLVALALPATAATYRIGIVQLVEHPALDASREGFLAELRDTGFIDEVEVIYQNAQNDPSLLAPIINNFINERVDLIQAITTPAGPDGRQPCPQHPGPLFRSA